MYCPNCNRSFPEGTAFCGTCGAPLVKDPKKKKKASFGKGLLCGLLIMAVIGGAVLGALWFAGRPAPRGYRTQEEAARAYMEAAAAGDPDRLLDTFALEEYTEHYDFEQLLQAWRAVSIQSGNYPPDSAWGRALMTEQRRCWVLQQLKDLYGMTQLPEWEEPGSLVNMTGRNEEYGSVENYMKEMQFDDLPKLLSAMKVTGICTCEEYWGEDASSEFSDFCRETVVKFSPELSGYDALSSVLIAYTFDGEPCCQELTQVCFDGRWYNLKPGGPVTYSSKTQLGFRFGFLSGDDCSSMYEKIAR